MAAVKIYAILFFTLCYTCAKPQVPSNGLVAYYSFDSHANDGSQYKNHGNVVGKVTSTADRFGNGCGAMQFDGYTGYVSVPSSSSLQSVNNVLSVTAWVKLSKHSSSSDKWITLLCKGDMPMETSSNPQFRLQVFQGASQSTVSINTEFTEYDNAYQQHTIDFGQWHFYALTYDGAMVMVYMDDVLIFQFAYAGYLNMNNAPLEIGRDVPGSMEYLAGSIDDLRIYNRVLTNAEVHSIYTDDRAKQYADAFTLQMVKNVSANSSVGKCGAMVNYVLPAVSTNCGNTTLKLVKGQSSNSFFAVGTNHIKYLAVNEDKQQTVSFYVRVLDKERPHIACPNDITYQSTLGETQARIDYGDPIVTDNCKGAKYILQAGLPSGAYFPVGKTQVKYKCYDAAGNESACSFAVNVVPAKADKPIAVLDTVAVAASTNIKAIDSVITVQAVPRKDSVKYSSDVVRLNDCLITLLIYDGGTEDNDTISAFFNGKLIADYVMLRNRVANSFDNIIKATIKLEPGVENYLVCKAWNTGKTWPNTMTMDVYAGAINTDKDMANKKAIRKVLETVPGVDGGIKFICK